MAARRGVWPPLDVVEGAEGREDETGRRLRDAEAVIGAVGEWTRAKRDPAGALEAIARIVQTYQSQPWVPVDSGTEAARVRRVEDAGDPDA